MSKSYFKVKITETLVKEVVILAEDVIEAEVYADELCNGGIINLDFDNLNSRVFETKGIASEFEKSTLENFETD